MSRSELDALLGRLFDDGDELELLGGLNFIGFAITKDEANGRYNISSPVGSLDSDDIANASTVSGTSVSDALDTLNTDKVNATRSISAGTNLTGGGNLTADRTIALAAVLTGLTSASFGTNPAAGGILKFANNTSIIVARNAANTQDIIVIRVDSSNSCVFGQDTNMANAVYRVPSGQLHQLLIGGGVEWEFSATGLDCKSNGLTNLATINGATVAAPVEGTALTDADQTLNVSGGNNYVQSTALTANRTKTLGTSGSPETGEVITIIRTTTAAFTLAVVNGGGGGGTLYTFPSASKRVADFRYDGTNWVLAGVKRLP